jgi:signal transduction histidine kinase
MNWQYHLIYMQAYFIPILLGAFQFGIRGGLGAAVSVTILYFPHIMLHWGGFVEENLMRFLQIVLFNVVGYLTGLKAQREMDEKERLLNLTKELDKNYLELKLQSQKLVEMEDQLRHSDRLAVIGELSASLAHEVRNPLGAIRGAVEIIRDEVPENSKEFEFAKILIDETQRLNTVVENYLGFAGKKRKKDLDFEVNEVIKNSILLLSSQALKKETNLEFEPFNEPINLKGDPNDLRQIIINLILNSLESIKKKGSVIIKSEKNSNNTELHISISDTGKGINENDLNKLFKPFYSTKSEGSGLGLAIVKRICDSNSWKINISSTVNIGSEFKIIIPLSQ